MFDVTTDFLALSYPENRQFTETYGFGGSHGMVHVEGILLRPVGNPSKTVFLFMHPSTAMHQLPVPAALAKAGMHVLCAQNRYYRNDTALIFEKVLIDYGAFVRHAKEVLGYDKVVLCGWSGGGALTAFYQGQAEKPTITHTPAGDAVDIVNAGLIPGDAVIYQAASISRARILVDALDPSVLDELDPGKRDPYFDIYDPQNPNQRPYTPAYQAEYRAAQYARMRRITARVKDTLAELKAANTGEMERCFVTHRTMADLRFMDPTVDPNDRKPQWCYSGHPETVNNGPVGLGRFSSLRSWLSQWSIDDSLADAGMAGPSITVPFLAIENTADDGAPACHMPETFALVASKDKTYYRSHGANHYYAGQPELLQQVVAMELDWLRERNLIDF